jgi:Phage integrase central domain/Arm DNA-binding domain/Prophage CP4-57 regulatory protein (AlpA)
MGVPDVFGRRYPQERYPGMLTDRELKTFKPREKPYKISAGGGLHLLINPSGSRLWRMKYRVDGREKLLSFGMYPEVSLKDARDRRDDARRVLRQGIDPGAQRKAEKAAVAETFEAIAREWFEKFAPSWAESHSSKVIRRLELEVFPWLGPRPIKSIAPPDLLSCLRRIEARGVTETAHRVHQCCGQIFRYADVRRLIWRLECAGKFPRRRQLGPRSVAWLQSDVDEWIGGRPAVGIPRGTPPGALRLSGNAAETRNVEER